MESQIEQDLRILEEIEHNPDITQADLASQLGLAVGSINWYIKRMINKGYIKVRQMQRRRLRYLITPQGIARKTHLTKEFMKASMRLYRETRESAQQYLAEITAAGYSSVKIQGDSDLAEVCYLTCIEKGINVEKNEINSVPTLHIDGYQVHLSWPDSQTSETTNNKVIIQ
jgi:DNA-binding MarR family transcriptional regulator